VRLGWAANPGDDPTWNAAVPYTIGQTLRVDDFVAGRYLAIRFETGTAFSWRLDGLDMPRSR
jgi:hypothetical protein